MILTLPRAFALQVIWNAIYSIIIFAGGNGIIIIIIVIIITISYLPANVRIDDMPLHSSPSHCCRVCNHLMSTKHHPYLPSHCGRHLPEVNL